jgi:phosphate transport system ATP-binding protein
MPKLRAEQLSCWLAGAQVLHETSLDMPARQVTALLGRSGSGKSTFLRCLNRLNDLLDGALVKGRVLLDGEDIYAPGVDLAALRKRVGLVLQQNSVFPGTVLENVTWAPRLHGLQDAQALRALAEDCLRRAALWGEVQGRLDAPAGELSGGQQQRLCIARALALQPEVLLMDEPVAALDPPAAAQVETLVRELKQQYTFVIVVHDYRFAERVADGAALFEDGRIVEAGPAAQLLNAPQTQAAREFLARGNC